MKVLFGILTFIIIVGLGTVYFWIGGDEAFTTNAVLTAGFLCFLGILAGFNIAIVYE